VSGRLTGVTQAVLRINAQAPESKFRHDLEVSYNRIAAVHPGEPIVLTITANVILKSNSDHTYSIYFGQSFGGTRAIYLGQKYDEATGVQTQLFSEFVVNSPEDLQKIPIHFNTEDFEAIYKRHFSHSDISVTSVVSLVYLLSAGIDRYDQEHTLGKTPVDLFF
jgi:hypothetical protein